MVRLKLTTADLPPQARRMAHTDADPNGSRAQRRAAKKLARQRRGKETDRGGPS